MRLAIAGGTGFIGRALTSDLQSKGHEVIIISRRNTEKQPMYGADRSFMPVTHISWEQAQQAPEKLGRLHAVINLAGATLNQRWSETNKQQMLQSRLQTVQQISGLLNKLESKPELVIQASAVGIYGTALDQTFTENSPISQSDYLSGLASRWEAEAESLSASGVRLIKLRTGVVLGNSGGAYPLMKLPFLLGSGGRIGSGKQWLSWIHINDMVSLIEFCLLNKEISGPVNAVSPFPVTNDIFGKTIASVYHRPYYFPLPAVLLRTLLGERATLLLDGQRVLPEKVLNAGLQFAFPELEDALANLKQQKN